MFRVIVFCFLCCRAEVTRVRPLLRALASPPECLASLLESQTCLGAGCTSVRVRIRVGFSNDQPSRVLVIAPSRPTDIWAVGLTPPFAWDRVKVSYSILRVSVFHGGVM